MLDRYDLIDLTMLDGDELCWMNLDLMLNRDDYRAELCSTEMTTELNYARQR